MKPIDKSDWSPEMHALYETAQGCSAHALRTMNELLKLAKAGEKHAGWKRRPRKQADNEATEKAGGR